MWEGPQCPDIAATANARIDQLISGLINTRLSRVLVNAANKPFNGFLPTSKPLKRFVLYSIGCTGLKRGVNKKSFQFFIPARENT
jgi:hypothetical protein